MPFKLFDFQPEPQPDPRHPLPPTWVDQKVRDVLSRHDTVTITPTGVTRESYLDLMEHLIRTAATWQAPTGAIIDPVAKEETGQTSPRFAASGAVLLHFGRVADLRPQIELAMDACCARLASGQAPSPDFWMRELMTAWMFLHAGAAPHRRTEWERQLRSIDPESIYWQVSRDGSKVADLHNWTVYGAAGEGMRFLAGLGPTTTAPAVLWGEQFFNKYMPSQLAHFTAEGMYRDPGDPFTYDMTTRLQFTTPLAFGLQPPLRPVLEELLRRGALAQLLYVSPEGFAPFGGRSNQIQMQEGILAALGEWEARRYRQHDPQLAGAFKRQARLSARSIGRWLTGMTPHRHIKNGFPPEQMHGAEPYAGYAMYSMFTASCLGLAAVFADESIAEAPTPSEIGGYAVEFAPAFHKVFAACGGTQIEIDTRADLSYDATGLGRIVHTGVPIELGLSTPFTIAKKHHIPEALQPDAPVTIGLGWRIGEEEWIDLATLSAGLKSTVDQQRESAEEVSFRITWTHPTGAVVQQSLRLSAGRLLMKGIVTVQGQPASAVRWMVPLLITNGESTTTLTQTPACISVQYQGFVYEVIPPSPATISFGRDIANRNGIYRPLVMECEGDAISLCLRLYSAP